MSTKVNKLIILLDLLLITLDVSANAEIRTNSDGRHSKEDAYRRAVEAEFGYLNPSNRQNSYDDRPQVSNSYAPYPHPFYEPYLHYKHGYLNEIDGRPRSKTQKNVDTYDGSFDEDATTIGNGHYTEYVHGDVIQEPIDHHKTKDEGQTEVVQNFKDMSHVALPSTYEEAYRNAYQPNVVPSVNEHKAYNDEKYRKCKFMESMKMREYMGDYFTDMICSMYKKWGEGMHTDPKWEPTSAQRRWFNTLGSKPPSGSRSKRQTGFHHRRAVRKEYRVLTDNERNRLHRAINILKHTFMDGLSVYDVIVRNHHPNLAPGAHFGPAFLGFHREYLLRFENALREIDPTVSLPYWDSNLDYILGDDLARYSVLWSPSFLGNGVGDVASGPFAYWRLPFDSRTSQSGLLHRNLTIAPPFARTMPALMSDEAVLGLLTAPHIRNISWFVDPMFESHHGAVHNWVGGVMADIPISPSDPVFFMHHAFLDCLWEQMRYLQKRRDPYFDPVYDYPNDSRALGVGMEQPDGSILEDIDSSYHHPLNPLRPFYPLRNIDGLSSVYFERFYTCQPSPVCSRRNPNCGTPYLFCDRNTYRCVPKLLNDAPCAEFSRSDPCLHGECCDGICREYCSAVRQRNDEIRYETHSLPHEKNQVHHETNHLPQLNDNRLHFVNEDDNNQVADYHEPLDSKQGTYSAQNTNQQADANEFDKAMASSSDIGEELQELIDTVHSDDKTIPPGYLHISVIE